MGELDAGTPSLPPEKVQSWSERHLSPGLAQVKTEQRRKKAREEILIMRWSISDCELQVVSVGKVKRRYCSTFDGS